ncbi:MAG: hypothetical protein ABIP14_10985 [Blastocatellia bacterium]
MPAVTLAICGHQLSIQARAPRLIRLFADYFRYYDPQIISSEKGSTNFSLSKFPNVRAFEANDKMKFVEPRAKAVSSSPTLQIELKMRDDLPPRERLIPPSAVLFSQTGVVSLWKEDASPVGQRFYFHLGVAAFRVEVETGRAIGLITPQAMEYPHILANTYALFALLMLLRKRRLYHLHAAAIVSPYGKLWLICGAQRAGKTTLATALGLAGWQPVSDDSLLVGGDEQSAWLTPLKKYFHMGDELLRRWPQLDCIERHHQYLDRTCTGGLEFFGTRQLAEAKFRRIDHVVLPQITNEQTSRIEPLTRSEALLRLAEQSMFFQLWRDHTARQWQWLNELAANAVCHRLFSAADILAEPHAAARVLDRRSRE